MTRGLRGWRRPAPAPDPAPEPQPEPTPDEPEAQWQGPRQEEWDQTQRTLQQANEFISMLQTPQYDEPMDAQPQELPAYDPYDPEAAQAYFEARDQRLLGPIEPMMPPVTSSSERQRAAGGATFDARRPGGRSLAGRRPFRLRRVPAVRLQR